MTTTRHTRPEPFATDHVFAVTLGGVTLDVSGEWFDNDPDAGLREGVAVDVVGGLDLPACPWSPERRAETARVLAAAGFPAGVTLDAVCTAWRDIYYVAAKAHHAAGRL